MGLALLVLADSHIPLLHHTYPDNQPDAPTFHSLTDALIKRYRELAEGAEHVTLVFGVPALLEDIDKIREFGVVYPAHGHRRAPAIKMTLSKLSEQQKKLYDTLDLERYRAIKVMRK